MGRREKMNQQKSHQTNKGNRNQNKQNARKASNTPSTGGGGGNKKKDSTIAGSKKNKNTNNSNNNKNVNGKQKEVQNKENEKIPLDPPSHPAPPKLERSKTFVFGHKLGKVIGRLTGSRESLNKIDELPPPSDDRFTLKRSLTLSSISLKRHNRKSLQKPILEELKEDAELEKLEPTVAPVKTFEPPPFKRSGSFIDRLRQKLGGPKPPKEPEMRSSWSASLQNLQQIDNMVDYKDMKFVNYDKFDSYMRRVERKISQTDMSDSQLDLTAIQPAMKRYPSTSSLRSIDPTVRLRPKKRISFNVDEDFLFRQSLDSNKFREIEPLEKSPKFQDEREYYEFLKKSFESEEKVDEVDKVDSSVNKRQKTSKINFLQNKSASVMNLAGKTEALWVSQSLFLVLC